MVLKSRPNIIFLYSDQHRGDAVGCMGNTGIRTPNLDQLAKGGICFTNAVATTPVCIASRYSLITGLRNREHHWVANHSLPGPRPELPTLMTILGANGYWTQGIGKFHFQPPHRHHGFHKMELMEEIPHYRENDDYLLYLKAKGYGHLREVHGVRNLLYQQPQTSVIPEEHVGSTWVADRAVEFLRSYQRKESFFLWVSWIAPHPPWNVPEPWDTMYQLKDMSLPVYYERPENDLPILCKMLRDIANTEKASPDRLRRIKALYYAQVSLIDKGVGRIMDELDRRGWTDNTLILYTSDHGEMLGDHNLCQKMIPYNGSVHIPLLLSWPNRVKSGQIYNDYVTPLDILPTCLDAAGLEYPGPHRLPGASLIVREGGLAQPRDEIIIELGAPPQRWISLRTKHYEFTVWSEEGIQELYDLQKDPGETRNIAREYPDLARKFYQQLVEWEHANGFVESLEGNRFKIFPARSIKRPHRNRQFPTWVKNLPAEELALMESPGQTVINAIVKETTFTLKELDLKTWKENGGDLSGTED